MGHPDFGRLMPCRCKLREWERERLIALRRLSNMSRLQEGMTFESFVPQGYGLDPLRRANLRAAYERAKEYAQNPEGWLILMGGYGCGKTHLAAAIANHCINRGQAALFIPAPDLLDHLRATFNPESPIPYDQRFEEVRNAPLLILDDLGTENATPWAREKLYQIFNHRYNAQLPTVITTNRPWEEIDPRLRSRMSDPDLCKQQKILARDFRASGDGQAYGSLSDHSDKTFQSFDLRKGELDAQEQENLRRALEIAQGFAQSPSGSLVFTGPFGCGKTHLAAAIANHRKSQGHPARFEFVPDLLDHLRATYSPQSAISYDRRFEEIRNAPLLVLDDLGTENATPWAREKLYQIFNHRYNARLPTIITMASPVEEADPRLRSRMLDLSRCTIFAILAPHYSGGRIPRKGKRRRGRR